MSYSEQVVLKPVGSQLVAATLGITLDASKIEVSAPVIQNLFEELVPYVLKSDVQVGSGMILYHDMELRNYRSVIVEVAIAIANKIPENGKVWIYELPGVENMATLVHRGTIETLEQAYKALSAWIDKNNYQIIGAVREVFLELDQDNQPSVTEVQFPERKL